MSTVEFVGDVLTEFARSFDPIVEQLQGGESFAAFLAEFGWSLDAKSDINVIVSALGKLPRDLGTLPDAIKNLENAYQQNDVVAAAKATLEFEAIIKDVVDTVHSLSQTTPQSIWPAPLNTDAFWSTFSADLLEYLFYTYLQRRAPKLFAPLRLIGVLSEDYTAPAMAHRVAYSRRSLRWDRMVDAVSRPQDLLSNVYGWGGVKFDAYGLLENIRAVAIAFNLIAGPNSVPQGILDHYYNEDSLSRVGLYELTIPIYFAVLDIGNVMEMVSIDLAVLPIPPANNKGGSPVGFAIYPRVRGGADFNFKLTPDVSVELSGNFHSEALVRAEIRPSSAGVFVDPTLDTKIESAAILSGQPASGAWILLGRKPGTRLELYHAHLGLRAKVEPDLEVIGEMAADSGALVIEFGEGDGFLSTVLKGSQKMEFGLGFAYSSKTGFRFNGQVGLEATIAIHQSLAGLLNLDSLYLAFHAKSDPAGASLIVAATGGVSIGPVVATVKKVGVSLDLTPVKKGDPAGNLGLANFGFGFKPPEGISVALTAPGVSGAGFLDIDTEHHQYLGAIAISVGDIDISAVGVLNTKLPEGSGYSLIVVVSASFPPIELGFGFDLTGIGGLVGVNRTVDVPSLQAVARSGGLDQLMFPEDLIHKAPQVAANLAAVFPAALQHFLIGPAVEIEWGEDGILDAEIGILIELSDAGGGISILRIALLGFFHITLPQAEAPVADITLDVLGLLDIPAKTISIDAGMRDSKVAGFTLTGQAALRAGWGAQATFVLALGGFNPAFNAPAGFPILARIALSLGDDNPRLRFASYFALTPNTLQFGAAADLYASEGPAAVTASLAFDVLIQFKPFGLLVDLTISAAILFNGSPVLTMNLALHLSGPDPWHVTGKASITVFFATFSVPINVTIGDAPPPQMPQTVSLDKNLADALADLHNWQIGPPAGGGGVVVRSFDQANKGVHPMASLTVRQHAVPLHQPIDRYGPDLVTPCSYDITKVQLGSQVVADKNITAVTDQFAPAQFITMSDADKLSAPSFEPMEAGVTIGAAGLVLSLTGPATDPQTKVVDMPSTRTYDLLTMDVPDTTPAPPPEPPGPPGPRPGGGGRTRPQLRTPSPPPPTRRQVALPGDLLRAQHAGAAAAVNGADGRGAARFRGPVTGFAVVHPTWAILGLNLAAQADGRVLRSDLSSMTAARSWVDREVPTAAVQVVYKSERPGAVALARRSSRV